MRTRLDKAPVTSLTASILPGPGLAPGKSANLVINATVSDGKIYVTTGAGKGKVLFDSFTFDSTLVKVSGRGVVSLPADPRLSENQTPHVVITPLGHPDIKTDLIIPVRYDVRFEALFTAAAGYPGSDGFSGSDGMPGSSGFMDAANPSAGGKGSDGGNGADGNNGGAGWPGPNVSVWLTLKPGASPPLLQARVAGLGPDQRFLIDPKGGTLSVAANGGPGGRAGSGGRGGRGGSGGGGIPPGSSGLDGRAGMDGRPGPGGRAGTITVLVDPAAKVYLSALQLTNRSGDQVPGPEPQIIVEPVAALW